MCYFDDGFTELSYFNILKQIVERVYSDAKIDKPLGGLVFRYKVDESINACAYINSLGQDCLDLNVGTVSFYFAYMKSVMSDKEVFKEFGSPNVESGGIVTGVYEPRKRAIFFTGEPKDPIRNSLSNLLSLIALRFVVAHEFGHLFNGHCDLLNTLYAVPKAEMIIKRIIPVFSESYALDHRTMEMDADSAAATSSIDNIVMLYQCWEENKNITPYDGIGDRNQLFKLWSFAVHSVFLIFEGLHKTDYSGLSFYLPNEARAMLVFNGAINALDEWIKHGVFACTEQDKLLIEQQVLKGILEAEEYFNRKFGHNYNYIASTHGNTMYVKYADEVLDYWNKKLRKKLEKYSRTPLYNPDTIDEVIESLKNK